MKHSEPEAPRKCNPLSFVCFHFKDIAKIYGKCPRGESIKTSIQNVVQNLFFIQIKVRVHCE